MGFYCKQKALKQGAGGLKRTQIGLERMGKSACFYLLLFDNEKIVYQKKKKKKYYGHFVASNFPRS